MPVITRSGGSKDFVHTGETPKPDDRNKAIREAYAEHERRKQIELARRMQLQRRIISVLLFVFFAIVAYMIVRIIL